MAFFQSNSEENPNLLSWSRRFHVVWPHLSWACYSATYPVAHATQASECLFCPLDICLSFPARGHSSFHGRPFINRQASAQPSPQRGLPHPVPWNGPRSARISLSTGCLALFLTTPAALWTVWFARCNLRESEDHLGHVPLCTRGAGKSGSTNVCHISKNGSFSALFPGLPALAWTRRTASQNLTALRDTPDRQADSFQHYQLHTWLIFLFFIDVLKSQLSWFQQIDLC